MVLAAGMSRRMGKSKPLLPLGDQVLIRRVVRNLVESTCVGGIVVVTGHLSDDVAAAVADLDVSVARNPDYDAGGMLSSIQTGIRAAPSTVEAVLVVLGDQPLIRPDTIRRIVQAWSETCPQLVVPAFEGKRGHPILISRTCLAEVLAMQPDETLKNFVTRHQNDCFELPIDDSGTTTDIDTPEDYEYALAQQKRLDASGAAGVQGPLATSISPTREGHEHV